MGRLSCYAAQQCRVESGHNKILSKKHANSTPPIITNICVPAARVVSFSGQVVYIANLKSVCFLSVVVKLREWRSWLSSAVPCDCGVVCFSSVRVCALLITLDCSYIVLFEPGSFVLMVDQVVDLFFFFFLCYCCLVVFQLFLLSALEIFKVLLKPSSGSQRF